METAGWLVLMEAAGNASVAVGNIVPPLSNFVLDTHRPVFHLEALGTGNIGTAAIPYVAVAAVCDAVV